LLDRVRARIDHAAPFLAAGLTEATPS
jgi:hypothetical protein